VAGEGGRSAPAPARARSQHFLRTRTLAAELVRDAAVGADDLVLDLGAGTGRLTEELARAARRVVAVELDPALARRLTGRWENVEVVEGDAARAPLPREPFRVVANLPFDRTNDLLRRLLDDPRTPLVRADLVVEWGVAQKRTAVWPSTVRGASWGAWYAFAVTRRLTAASFVPPPSVAAGVLRVERRCDPLVSLGDARAYHAFVRSGFKRGLSSVVAPRLLRRLADRLGFARGAAPRDLDVHQWAALFRAVRARGQF
jgi:23S rRNA (adenine-N6)-dimethyltransferase